MKKKREYDPCDRVAPHRDEDIIDFSKRLSSSCPTLQVLRYLCPHKQEKVEESEDHTQKLINDDADLWSTNVQIIVKNYMKTLKPLDERERAQMCSDTLGQAENQRWYAARTGRLTASLFKRICRCIKPEGLLKSLLYPSDRAVSEAIAYGRTHEKDAVEAYQVLAKCKDLDVVVQETGLHIHKDHPFLAASPDRIILINGEQGLLEVKCPISKKGLTVEEACQDPKFCCRLEDGEAVLKTEHAYYYQVQGQMAVTGHSWCDFAIWTEGSQPMEPRHIHVQRIYFNKMFWETEMFPALLHFMKYAFVAELLTRRVKRLRKLYTCGQYVSHKMLQRGFYTCQPGDDGLKIKITKLQ